MSIEIRAAAVADRERVVSFLRGQGYARMIDEGDRYFIAEHVAGHARRIVGAVRLSSVEPALVLRGMRIDQPFQRQGIGRRLLALVAEEMGPEICYCLPYSWLVSFYGEVGFRQISAAEAPSFLAARHAQYVAEGQDVILMRRR